MTKLSCIAAGLVCLIAYQVRAQTLTIKAADPVELGGSPPASYSWPRPGLTSWVRDPKTAGDWFDATDLDNGVPSLEDTAYFDNWGTAQIAAGSGEARELYLGGAFGGLGKLELTGGELLATEKICIGESGEGG